MDSELGDHAVSGIVEAPESLFGSIKREISYVLNYQSHIDDLENQVKELGYKRQRVEHPVNVAKRQGDEIYKGVEQWLISVDEFTQRVVQPIIEDEDEAKKRCLKGLCPNLLKRYNLSKEAVKAAKVGANLLGKGNFSNFSFCPAPRRTELMSSSGYGQFNSRRSTFRDIMEALKDEKVNMIGVYGLDGVGKTTLVKEIARQVMEDNLFDEVAMAEVTQTLDQKPIQDKIASDLGLQFGQADSVLRRAGLLSERLKKEERVLIILDNVLTKLDLDAIGIPLVGDGKEGQQEDWKERFGVQSRCTILFTSRNQYVLCNDMNIQKTFTIGVLSDEEAMSLLWNNVGDAAERSDFLPVGVEIVRECGGFPIAVKTIANALKNKILFFWKDAFDQLRNSNQRHIIGVDANLYSTIELSFNFLESEEAKLLFRFCGLLNDGNRIPIDDLMRYGMGLGLLKNVYTLVEARKRVHMLVKNLRDSCLLLEGDAEECFKMHDIIHSIAVSVAAEKLMFNMKNVADLKEELEKKTHKDPTAISIPFRGIYELPQRLECPKLQLFLLFSGNHSLQIPDLFFEGMTELRVLDLTGFCFPSLPSSLGCLISLRTLTLESCLLGDVTIIGDLKRLEILSLRYSDVEQLPVEIGQLTRLKLLDLSNCTKLKVIRPNVISGLSRLEELYMGNSFSQWEIEGQNNASLVELKQLSRLTTLDVHIPNAQVILQDLVSVELERYRMCIGDVWSWSGEHETSRRLKLNGLDKHIYLGCGMQMLLKGIEDLYLDELNGNQNMLHELEDGEGFPRLKHLHVQNISEISYIVNLVGQGRCNAFPLLESLFLHNLMNLEKIYHGQHTEQSFSKLRKIKVRKCEGLKQLFSFSMARNLLQLQEIKASYCESLTMIVGEESSETHHAHEIINFSQLHSLTLQCLPQLTSSGFNLERPLISPMISATTSASKDVISEDDYNTSLFNNKVIFPSLQKLKLSSINIEKIWPDQILPMSTYCSQNLTNLTVETCSRLKFLFSYSMVDSLVLLQQLEIRKCESMEAVVDTTGFGMNLVEFPSLRHLRIDDCPNLRRFISMNPAEENILHNDTQALFDEKVGLPCLEVLGIDSMGNLRKIWHHQLALNSFSKLKALEVINCGKLVSIFPANVIIWRRLERLEYLKVDGCDSIEEIIGETSSNGNICMVVEEEEACRKFVFPRLTWLYLHLLPRLKSFCPGLHIGEWPMLKCLGVFECDNVEILFASTEFFSFESQRPLFLLDHKFAFPSLKKLELYKLRKLMHMWKENSQASKVFQNLATLEISECSKLEKLVPSSVSFENLTTMEVSKCDGLIHLVTSSTAESLVKLTRMNVTDCKMIVEIIEQGREEVKKDRIVFSQLKYLGLHCIPSLTSFCLGNYTLEFPCLEQVIVRQCPKMKIFSQGVLHTPKLRRLQLKEEDDKELWEGSLNSTIKKLFEEMVGYHGLARFVLSQFPHLKEIWHGHALSVSFFINLRWLVVDDCRFMSSAIPANRLQNLINLKTLEIKNCHSLEEVFHLEELNPNEHSPALFPKLRNLKLIDLPKLIRFCNFTGTIIELPSLVNLWIKNCPNMKTLVSSSTPVNMAANKEPQEMTSEKNVLADIQALFDEKVKLPSLEVLGISHMKNLRKIWHYQLSLDSFCKLNDLVIHCCEQLPSIFPWNMLERLQKLVKLEVLYCDSVQEISERQPINCGDMHALKIAELRDIVPSFAFSQLTLLKLQSLPRLRSFYPGVHISEWPMLTNLHLSKCARVEIFASELLSCRESHSHSHYDIHIQQPFFYVNKVAFPSLEKLKLHELPKLLHLWKENSQPSKVFQNLATLEVSECSKLEKLVPSSVSFENLTTMEVSKCDRLIHLVTSSTAESLVKLTRMNVTDCKMIEEIIKQVGEEVKKNRIVFSQLKYLELHCLPSFTSFYWGNHTLELPSLEKVVVRQCPKMKFFCQGVLSTPKLRRLQLAELEDEGRWEGSFNSTVQKLFEEMVGFCGLKYLELSQFPNLKEQWHGQLLPVSFFSNLRSLVVDDCTFFSSAIPANLLRFLNNLEMLEVSNCDSLEEVLHLEELNADEQFVPLFPKLRKLKLKDLPKLTRFCNSARDIIQLPSLTFMWIENCPNMVTFVSNSTFAHMRANKEPQEMITEENILADIQPLFDEKVGLPNLEELGISLMDNLRKIWHDQLSLDSFNKLNHLGIGNCNKLLNIFPQNMLGRLQTLRWLFVGNCDSLEEIFEHRAPSGEDTCPITGAQLRETIPTFVFPQLMSLTLSSLPKLKSLYLGLHISQWPMLKKLEVMKCAEVEIFASEVLSPHETNVDSQLAIKIPHPLFSVNQVAFPSLEELTLCVLPDLLLLWEEDSQPSKVFQNLVTLKVSECGKLENLVPSSVSFQNLMTLEVSKCDWLINLVTLSTAESLVKLTTMHITECIMIEEIIQQAGEGVRKDGVLFSQLKYLGLHCLPSLMCFCLGNYALEFPALEKVVVRQCPKMEIFSQGVLSTPKLRRLLLTELGDEGRWEGNLNSTIQKLFGEMVGLCDVRYLELSQFPHLKEIWHGQAVPVSIFRNLTWLVVDDCTFFPSAIPVNLLRFLNNLKILEVSNCNSLEEVFHLEELNAGEHFWPLFPKLCKLKLNGLPKLIRFCNFNGNKIELPSLSYMWIESCPNMVTFISNSTPVHITVDKEPHEMTLEENFLADIQPLFDEKVGLPSLEELAILSMDNLKKVWQDQLTLDSFCNLKFLGVQKCNKLLNIFPCNMLERLQKLQKLQVLYCDYVREIFELQILGGRDTHTIKAAQFRETDACFVFPRLTSLSLWWLPRLKSFYPRAHNSKWPMLKKLDVGGCAEVEIFASEFLSLQETHVGGQHDIQTPQPLFLVDKVGFPSLEELRLFRLPKLLHLWKEISHPSKVFQNLETLKLSECRKLVNLVSSSVSFQNLTTLEVSKCDGLINLVTFSTAESLVQLVRMSITDCKLIEEIIQPVGEEVRDCIVFSQLKYLGLHCLPSLTSFCLGNYTLEFPSLEQVIVTECLKMMIFSQGVLCTPKLHRLQLTEEDDEGCWDGNLNNTIQQLFKRVNFQSSNDVD